MKITRLKIHNILGITELECTPGAFNEITGSNGKNKTNILNAIKSVVEGGHDATLLRNGADKGEVVLMLDDGVELRKTVTAKGSRVEVKKGEVPMKRPMETIASLADLFSINPIAFLSAPKADRARVLLESMPIDLDRSRLANLTGFELPAFHPGMHPLAIIDAVRKQVYDERTAVNRVLEEKRGTIEQLRRAMPEAPAGIDASESDVEAQIGELVSQEEKELAELNVKVDAWMADKDARVAEMQTAYGAQMDALKQQIADLTAQYNQDTAAFNAQTASAKDRKATRTAEIKERHAAARVPMTAQLSVLKANRSAVAKREQTQETIHAMVEAAELLATESGERTAALESIDEYKQELLSALPIPNVEVVNGEITRKGVPFDRLNTAQRVDIAIEIAKLRAGKLGVVCADGLELLDEDAYQDFEKKAQKSGLQFFITKVGTGDLTINTRTESYEEVH